MKNFDLEKRIKSLSSLPTLKRKNKDMSFMDEYSDDKIHDICEACHTIVHMKFPLENKKKNQLKKKLAPIKKEVRQLGNPKLYIYMHRKECFYLDKFIDDANSVLKSVTFYHVKDDISKIDTNLVNEKYELNGLSVEIHKKCFTTS